MQILVDLVKIGAIGASLAFLYLSFKLLQEEMSLKDKDQNPVAPRKEVLTSIGRFRWSALAFLIVGVFSEFFLSHGMDVVNIISQSALKSDLSRVRFNEWEFSAKQKLVAFSFEENRINPGSYVMSAIKDRYEVYIGLRKKSAMPFDQGEYAVMLGPYRILNQSRLQHILGDDDLKKLGDQCVELTAFGVKAQSKITKPFDASKFSGQIIPFNSASVCD